MDILLAQLGYGLSRRSETFLAQRTVRVWAANRHLSVVHRHRERERSRRLAGCLLAGCAGWLAARPAACLPPAWWWLGSGRRGPSPPALTLPARLMSGLSTLGLFSEPGYISINDPYADGEKKGSRLSRYYGKQFTSAPPKMGQAANDVYFEDFKRLYEGEKYADPGLADRVAQVRGPAAETQVCCLQAALHTAACSARLSSR